MNNSYGTVQAQSAAIWLLYVVSSLWLAISLSWSVYARFDYGYSFWYDQLEIGAHIRHYAAQHPQKPEFAQLPREQHLRAFEQISNAVHQRGEGLEDITFSTPKGRTIRLLDNAEVQHLRDVAKLLSVCLWITIAVALSWLAALVYFRYRPLPTWRFRVGALSAVSAAVIVLLLVAGPRQVFYQFHVWIFPPQHQWFFYWEQSLMSTLMKAPDLFGGIAVVLVGVGMPVALLLYLGGFNAIRLLARR